MTIDKLSEYERCINCEHYDPTPFPEYEGKLALCRGDSYMYKVGCFTLASRECFTRRTPRAVELGGLTMESLAEALTREIERVQEIIRIYETTPNGQYAAAGMKQDVARAHRAMMEGDVAGMVEVYEALKEWEA